MAEPGRAYTAQEVDELRNACGWRLMCGRYGGPRPGAPGAYNVPPRADIEEMTRTCIAAGLTLADLLAADS